MTQSRDIDYYDPRYGDFYVISVEDGEVVQVARYLEKVGGPAIHYPSLAELPLIQRHQIEAFLTQAKAIK